jgi:RNA polymerase sigma-70 factor (ECF subfamily)
LAPNIPLDEKALLVQLQAGSADAFTQLYQAYAERLYYNILSLVKDGSTAEELVQDIFARIWQKRETIQIDTNFGAYLFAASRNRVYDFFRKLDRDHDLYACIKAAASYEYTHIEEALLKRENVDMLQ